MSACQIRRNPRNRSRTQRSAFRPRQGDPTQNDKSTQRFREDVEFDYRTALFTQPRAIADALDLNHLITSERRLRNELAKANEELDTKVTELDEKNQLLEYWVEFSPAVLYSFTFEGDKLRPSYVSKNFARLTGHERTAIIVDPGFWAENVHPDDRATFDAAIAELFDSAEADQTIEYRFKHKSGEYRNVVDSMRVIRNVDGRPLEIVGAWLDLSLRRQ